MAEPPEPPEPPGFRRPPPPAYRPPIITKPVPRPNPQGLPIFSGTYVVKPGETLKSISARYHISVMQLAHANGLGTGAGLRTGTKLHVPGPLRTRAQGGPG